MNLFLTHKRIISIVATVMVVVLVVYSYGSFNTYAASPEVSTLPADIDIDVSYDADNLSITYCGNTYSFYRHAKYYDMFSHLPVLSDKSESAAYSYFIYDNCVYYNNGSGYSSVVNDSNPDYYCFEYTKSKYIHGVSYWFSPSTSHIYIISEDYSGYGNYTSIRSYDPSTGCIIVADASGSSIAKLNGNYYRYFSVFVYDINTKSLIASCPDNNTYRHSVRSDIYYNSAVGYRISYSFPNDLVCLFSNKSISGFFEPDTSKVNTPSYYFNYQYIFYNVKYGYIFVDSASKLKDIGYPSGVNNPRFMFSDVANFYIYTSVDGISWTLNTTALTMYSDSFELKTNYGLAGNLRLVYTNDDTYGEEPLLTPEYGDINDIIGDLSAITNNYHYTRNDTNVSYLDTSNSSSSLWDYFGTVEKAVLNAIEDYTGFPVFSVFSKAGFSDSSDESILLGQLLNNFSSDKSWYYDADEKLLHTYTSLYGYVHYMYEAVVDNGIFIDSFMKLTHSDIKSVFDNITLTNQYLSRIYSRLDDINVPSSIDYSGKFDKLSAALDMLHNDLSNLSISVPGTTDYSAALDKIVSAVSNDFTKPYSMGTYSTMIYNKLSSFNDMVSTKFDSVIAAIPSGSGGTYTFDDSNMVGAVASLKSELSGKFDTLLKLLNNDTDDITDFKDLSDFLTSYIVSMGNAAYFTTLLDFADGVKNNVVLINDTMYSMVSDSGIYAPVFVLGAGFAVFSGLIRKERMS